MRKLFTLLCLVAAASQLGAAEPTTTKTGFPLHATAPKGLEPAYERIMKKFGFIPNAVQVMAESPALLKGYFAIQSSLDEHSTLSMQERNLVQLVVSVENKCHYCVPAHCMVGKMMKMSDSDLEAVVQQKPVTDAKMQALQSFTVAVVTKKGHISKEEMKAFLDAGYTRAQALDVVSCVAAKVITNYTNALAETEVDAQLKSDK